MGTKGEQRGRSRVQRAALVLAAAVLAAGVPPLPPAAASDPRPNIVLFVIDDLDALTMPYWDALARTRALLADRGMTFENAFAPTPICCPARATILTGEYGHNTGVLTNAGPHGGWPVFVAGGGEERSFPLALQQAGYRTMLAGKYLNETEAGHIPPGWTEWYGAANDRIEGGYNFALNENGSIVWYGTGEDDYATDVVAAKTVDFVRRAATDPATPFFAYVAPTAPHLPVLPARRHSRHPWRNAEPPAHPNSYEADLSDKPRWLQASGPVRSLWRGWNRVDYRNRMGSLLAVDDLVASTVAALDESGALDDTYLIFASDNGYNLGAHRLVHKMAPYEESLRVPFVVAGPDVPRGSDTRTVVLPDLAPTIRDLAGVEVPDTVDGRSLVPLLRGEDPGPWRDAFPIRYASGGLTAGLGTDMPPLGYFLLMVLLIGHDVPSYRGVRTDTHTYIEWYDAELGGRHEYELYDRSSDPWQLRNLLATPEGRAANETLVAGLRARTDALGACAGPSCRVLDR